jgi:hypothetical protein
MQQSTTSLHTQRQNRRAGQEQTCVFDINYQIHKSYKQNKKPQSQAKTEKIIYFLENNE